VPQHAQGKKEDRDLSVGGSHDVFHEAQVGTCLHQHRQTSMSAMNVENAKTCYSRVKGCSKCTKALHVRPLHAPAPSPSLSLTIPDTSNNTTQHEEWKTREGGGVQPWRGKLRGPLPQISAATSKPNGTSQFKATCNPPHHVTRTHIRTRAHTRTHAHHTNTHTYTRQFEAGVGYTASCAEEEHLS